MYSYSGCTVLVTGATGLIGSNLVHRLMTMDGVQVIAVGRNKEKLERCFTAYVKNKNFQMMAWDISQPLYLEKPVHYIFHAAGPISGNIISQEPLQVIAPNLLGTRNCLELLKEQREKSGIAGRMVVFSSATVYGKRDSNNYFVSEEETEIAEKLSSLTAAYSETKRMVEVLALAYARQYRLDVVTARFSYVYGYAKYMPNTAFYSFIEKALCGEEIVIQNPLQRARDNIFVEDAVDGVLLIGKHGVTAEVYNVSSNGEGGNYASILQMAEDIVSVVNEKRAGEKPAFLKPPDVELTIDNDVKMDNQKLKSLGWSIKTSMRDGIAGIIEKKTANEQI